MLRIVFIFGFLQLSVGFLLEESCVQDKILDLPVELPRNYYCENVNITKGYETATYSDQKYIVFRNSHIFLDHHFLRQFPNCSEMYFDKVHLELEENSNTSNHRISSMFLSECDVVGNMNFFSTLPNLNHFAAFSNHFADLTTLDNSFFGNNTELKVLTLFQNNVIEILGNTFEGISSIEMLTLSENLGNFTVNISDMSKLIYLDFSGNHLTHIPCNLLPENIIELSLSGNNISNPTFDGCKFQSSLKRLYMEGNGIENLELKVFKDLTNIEEIHLNNNELSNLNESCFTNLEKLKKLVLTGNSLFGVTLKLRDDIECIIEN